MIMAMSTARMPVQTTFTLAYGRSSAKGNAPQDREPHDGLASHTITDRSPRNSAGHDAGEEGDPVGCGPLGQG